MSDSAPADMAALLARAEAAEAQRDAMREALLRFIKERDDDPECFSLEPTCNDCTQGQTPVQFDKGPCPYHQAHQALSLTHSSAVEERKAVVDAFNEIAWSNDSRWQSDRAKAALEALDSLTPSEAVEQREKERKVVEAAANLIQSDEGRALTAYEPDVGWFSYAPAVALKKALDALKPGQGETT